MIQGLLLWSVQSLVEIWKPRVSGGVVGMTCDGNGISMATLEDWLRSGSQGSGGG